MKEQIIPASPNWYCSKVTDSNSTHIVFGCRHDVYIFECNKYPPNCLGIFVGHKEKVTALTLSSHPNYSLYCCSGSDDGNVKLWSMDDRTVKIEHSMHNNKVTCVCWSPGQADLIVSGDENGFIGVWQFETNKQAAHRPEKGAILCMAASPQSAGIIAVGYRTGQILLVDVKRGGLASSRLRGHDEEIYTLVWCPIPGEMFMSSQASQDITDLETFGVDDSWANKQKEEHAAAGSFGSEGWLLASGSKDKSIRVWSTSKARQLLQLKLPQVGKRERVDDVGGKSRAWLTLCWLKQSPEKFVSSSNSGDLLIWDITKSGKERCKTLHTPGLGHSRFAFNICPVGGDTKVLCTISMDRQIMFWDVDLGSLIGVIPTLGGYVYTLKTSHLDPGRIAMGVGDSMIRVWNINSQSGWFDMTPFWQGIRSKVTALSWHPVKEGLLAYGTDDGRIGIYDILSNKPPQISTTYHRRTVYVVAWGPPSISTDDQKKQAYHIYSCGDGNILEHVPRSLDKEAVFINKLITDSNPHYRCESRVPTRSEISWNPDFRVVAVGNDDGTVEIYQSGKFVLLAVIQTHHKLVNCALWHPHVTMATPNGSVYTHFLATCSNENHISVVDLTNVLESKTIGEPLLITDSWRKLEGHTGRVTGLAWSPHKDGFLASVSYDGKALVWNVIDGTPIACYSNHLNRLLCIQWNGLDPDMIITGGDDFSARVWSISEHQLQPGERDVLNNKKKRHNPAKINPSVSSGVVEIENRDVTITMEYEHEINKLLEDKKKELMVKEGITELASENDIVVQEPNRILKEEKSLDKLSPGKNEQNVKMDKTGPQVSMDKKKKKPKSMFPEMCKRENQARHIVLQDIINLAKLIYASENNDVPTTDVAHLGLFLDRKATNVCLAIEGEYHRNNDNMDYFYQLEIWKGNINGALQVARQRDELSDWLVAMAPMASLDTWNCVCEDYALQLESDGQYHKAASYFLACNKVYEAIRLFKRHKLFKEAIALAKVRLSPVDPVLEEMYTLWAQQLTKDGNYEQAAKCHLAMKQVQDAAKLLARRYDQSCLRTAAHISLIGNNKQQALMYTQRVVQQYLLQHEWSEAYSFLEKKDLQVHLAISSLHEMLCHELTTLGLLSIDQKVFTKFDQKTDMLQLPEFMLDPDDVDNLSPWPSHLVEGRTFPHHVLRIWYSHFSIAMDTASVEDMYKTLCLLHAGRQTQVDLPQVLIQVCTDLTLCMLSLMMSETPTSTSHLLHAVGGLHEAGHFIVMQGVLRLFLPQGPKYLLRLQQEVTAMRVMISMDAHAHIDGASKVHTIKRYLSEMKDEKIINTSSLRCREIDCLRAYYYVAILNFLKENWFSEEASLCESNDNELLNSNDNRESDVNCKSGVMNATENFQDCGTSIDLDENGNNDLSVNQTEDMKNANVDSSKEAKNGCENDESADIKMNVPVANVTGDNIVSDIQDTTVGKSDDIFEKGDSAPASLEEKSPVKHPHSKSQSLPMFRVNCYSVTNIQIAQLSQGLLWDLQAKRYALTETLGYIHKAISQLLLSKNPSPSDTSTESPLQESALEDQNSHDSGLNVIKTEASSGADGGQDAGMEKSGLGSWLRSDQSQDNQDVEELERAITMALDKTFLPDNQSNSSSILDHVHKCIHHSHEGIGHIQGGQICHSVLSQHFDQMISSHIPHLSNDDVPVHCEAETEFKCSFFEVCSSCEVLHKSRKILFEDEHHFHSRQDVGFKDLTNVINPAKYINVPDEWYGMPVDQKYFKRYVTMAILKDEQEYVMGELKGGPDSTQYPFPSPLDSIICLLTLAQHSSHLTPVEKQEFIQKVITWGLNFSVTSKQKQTFLNLLQSNLEK